MADDQIRIATAEEGYDRQDPQGIPVFGFAAIIVVTLIASFIFVTYYYTTVYDNQIQRAVGDVGARELSEVHAAEDVLLTRYKKVVVQDPATKQEKTVINLPLERAMELFEQEAKAGKLFYPAKPMPVKTAADLAAPAGAPPVPGAAAAPGAAAEGDHGKK
jgi:hypothetical protein